MDPRQQQAYPDYGAAQEQEGARPFVREVNWRGGWPGLRAGESQTVALQRALDELTGNGYRVVGVAPEEWNVWVRLLWAVVAAGTVGFVVRQPKVDVLAEPVGFAPTAYPDGESAGYGGSWQEYPGPGQDGDPEYADFYSSGGYDNPGGEPAPYRRRSRDASGGAYDDADDDGTYDESDYDESDYDESDYDESDYDAAGYDASEDDEDGYAETFEADAGDAEDEDSDTGGQARGGGPEYDGGSRQLQYAPDYSEEEEDGTGYRRDRPATGAAGAAPAGPAARSRPPGSQDSRPARRPVSPSARPTPGARRPAPRPRAAAARTRELPPLPPAQARRLLSPPAQDDPDRVIDLVDRPGGGEPRRARNNGRRSGRLDGFEEPAYDEPVDDEAAYDEAADDEAVYDEGANELTAKERGDDESAYDEMDEDVVQEQAQADVEDNGARVWNGGVFATNAQSRDVGHERGDDPRTEGIGTGQDWDDPDEVAYASMSRSEDRDEDADDGFEDADDRDEDAEPARRGRSAEPRSGRRPSPRPPGRRPSPGRGSRPYDDEAPRRREMPPPTAGGRASRWEAPPAEEPRSARARATPPRRPAAPARPTPGERRRSPAPTPSRRPRPRG